MTERDSTITRRHYLGAIAASSTVALAGCTGVSEYVPFVGGDDDEYDLHEHGYLFIDIDGETVDFSESKYLQEQSDRVEHEFHFHEYDEVHRWHMHDERLTLAEALNTLPDLEYSTDGDAPALTIDEETYTDGDGVTITAIERVAGEIDPDAHELHDGDIVEVQVESDDEDVDGENDEDESDEVDDEENDDGDDENGDDENGDDENGDDENGENGDEDGDGDDESE